MGLAALICTALASCTAGTPSAGNDPDLEVTSVAVSDSGPAAGATFTLSATVRNAGEGASEATTLRYYRSADATITTTDEEIGTDPVAGLAASGTESTGSMELVAPSTPGAYYYGACVDPVTTEMDPADNCSTSVKVTVQATIAEAPDDPDARDPQNLVVTSPLVSDSAPAAGTEFTLSVAVRNAGGRAAMATTVRYFQSTDATITKTDREVGRAAVAELAASATSSQSVDLTAPGTPGTYYYGACVDAVPGESDTADNCSASVKVEVEFAEPTYPPVVTFAPSDLFVHRPGVTEQFPDPGEEIRLSAYVENVGGGESPETTLRYFRSADRSVSTSDTEVGTNVVSGLGPGNEERVSITLNVPSADGTHYYGACVDAVAGETDTSNNCSRSVAVTLSSTGPDLITRQMTLSYPPETKPGHPVKLWVQVFNAGRSTSAATTMRFYRSDDVTISASDTAMGTDEIPALDHGDDSWPLIDLTAPAAGTYYYGGCIDAVPGESHTTNNCSDGIALRVTDGN